MCISLDVRGNPAPVVEGVDADSAGFASYAVGTDGLAYIPTSGNLAAQRSLVWVDREGNEEPMAEPRPYTGVALSPDGGRVALQVNDPENIDLVIYDVARDTPTRFTFDPGADQMPMWTPDGERVVFTSTRDGIFNLYWKAADGTGQVERLTTSDNIQAPTAVSPDGMTLLFAEIRPQTGLDIGALSVDGDHAVNWLLENEAFEGHTDVSPDGRWIAYASNESGQFEVYVRPFPNVDEGRWQISRAGGVAPRWGPDSREVFFQTGEGPGSPVTLMVAANDTEPTFNPGIPRPLFEGPYRLGVGTNPWPYAVSPDGQRFLMIKEPADAGEAAGADIVPVQNWHEELTRLVPID